MRKKWYGALLFTMLFITACGSRTEDSTQNSKAEATVEEIKEAAALPEEQTTEALDTVTEEETILPFLVENPSWEYYTAQQTVSGTQPYTLVLKEERANQITDTEEWLAQTKLGYASTNDTEYFSWIEGGNDITGGSIVNIYKDGSCIVSLDFSKYLYSPDYLEEDKDFVDEKVHDAKVVNGVLYVSIFHYTYAKSAPSNGYIAAIRLENQEVLWKSKPLVCNSLNFEIVDDIIFCGYGFTQEKDYLYQLDRLTGAVLDELPLKSKPDYILYKEEKLYVRTYNTDYVFELQK